jgi:hypothetical protein
VDFLPVITEIIRRAAKYNEIITDN